MRETGKLSLTAKNPFGKDMELVSTKTWIGVGAFALVIGVLVVAIKGVSSATEKALKNPALSAYKDIMG